MRGIILLFISFVISPLYAQTYDIIIRHGKIIDGSGNSWYYGDVGIKAGKIVAIGKLQREQGKREILANGLIVAPGFIDVHTHVEGESITSPTATNFIFDGVTSVVTGNCGGSNLDLANYFRQLDSVRTSINIASLIGHNTVRRAVMGDLQRDPTPDEQLKMEALVEKAMKEGAVGFSTGLIYVPGTYSKTPEVVGLAKASSKYNGVYASHIRDEGDHVVEAVNEAIAIGREAKMPVEISHFKVTYKPNWGRSTETIGLVEKARQEGIDVTVDQYPYIASSTTLDTTLPTWAFGGGRDSLKVRISDPKMRQKIKNEMVKTLQEKQLKNYSYAVVSRYPPDTLFNGKNISEINQLKGRGAKPMEEAETILDMVGATNRTQMVFFSMNENDLVRIMQYPFNMIASDAGIAKLGSGMPHPRAYGTNARVLGRYVNELKTIRLEEAIRRMTSLPAQKFNLHSRGLIREGMAADLVVFDEKTVGDRATFANPHAYSNGFHYVIVDGEVVINDSKFTGVRSGNVLKDQGGTSKSEIHFYLHIRMGNKSEIQKTFFAPHLAMKNVLAGMEFYKKAFGAIELRRFSNEDGSVHVGEMEIKGALFHIHEETPKSNQLSPEQVNATTNVIGTFTPDPDTLFNKAVAAGATVSSPMQDYDYGYRQGIVIDPFGHQWLIQKKI